jgi:hypothetical protein
MIFSSPIPFAEAVASRRVKAALPGDFSAAEFSRLPAALRERAMFSARTTSATYLQSVNTLIERIVNPSFLPAQVTAARTTARLPPTPAGPGQYMDKPTARLLMKQELAALGYQPDPEKRGGLQDLSSDRRINLILEMQTDFSRNYGFYEQSQDPAILDEWPAQEMLRIEERQLHRDWSARWNNAIGELSDSTSAKLAIPGAQSGFYALKNDPIWPAISRFGLPYPPFDYNSGMGVRDVDRAKAESLGLLAPADPGPAPAPRGLNDDLSVPLPDLAPSLLDALLDSFAGAASLDDGILSLTGGVPS